MADTTRIIVGKNDEATVVAEQLIDAETDTIIFVVPRGAAFGQSINNFKLLKREGDVLSKEIIIESDDESVQEKAVRAGLEIGQAVEPEAEKGKLPRGRSLKVTAKDEDEEEPVRRLAKPRKKIEPEPEEVESEVELPRKTRKSEPEPVRPTKSHSRGNVWRFAKIGVSVAFLGALAWVLLFTLPKAEIALSLESATWKLETNVVADKSISSIDVSGSKIPGQIFTQKSSVITKMPATGSKFVEEKATGVITVYNAYSSQPQSIVANTRFLTPSGIVFRLVKALVIPGAKIENGTILPSSVTAQVIADKAGVESNVGPIAKLTIPGFAKTPKYNGFYGELKEGTSGGFKGQSKIATDSDIKAAKAEGAKRAEKLAREQLGRQLPEGFKVIDVVTAFVVNRQTLAVLADSDGNFSVTTDAQLSAFAFKESDMKTFIAARRDSDPKNKDFVAHEESAVLSYGAATGPNTLFLSGKVAMPITYTVPLIHVLDEMKLKAAIAGKPQRELQTLILGTPGVVSASVDLWPFYVRSVPSSIEKITISTQ